VIFRLIEENIDYFGTSI